MRLGPCGGMRRRREDDEPNKYNHANTQNTLHEASPPAAILSECSSLSHCFPPFHVKSPLGNDLTVV